uniref:Uncharacterized protein LOC100184694 n=1 Tax=Phallusia mammillata TaxID=59560 RepID=A0A6F9DHF6_9ASCI|nr:uncharacterized protein LOC100184694 [Phallusia mammillata]
MLLLVNFLLAVFTPTLCDIISHAELVAQDPAFHIKFPKPILPSDGISASLVGHLEELGLQSPPIGQIPEYFHSPTPRELWDTQVKLYRPAVYRGMLNGSPAVGNWTHDEYLIKEYGDQEVLVEKKFEDRKSEPKRMTIEAFLKNYKEQNWYIVTILPNAMRKDVKVPKPLMCSSFNKNLQELNLWVGTHGTRSKLHYDADNIIHCVVAGRKDWILINPEHKPKLDMVWGAKGQGSGFSHLDVDNVNLTENPDVSDIPWEYVSLYAGDCLYLPPQYLHQVRSYNRSVSSTFLFYPRDTFSDDDCKELDLDSYLSLSDVYVYWVYEQGQETVDMGYQNPVNVRRNTVATLRAFGIDTMSWKEFLYVAYMTYGEEIFGMSAVIKNLFKGFDIDGDQIISIEDIENMDIEKWKDFCRATDSPHGPTKSELSINDEKSEKSPEFNPRDNDYYRDVKMARRFLNFIVKKHGRKNLLLFPEFKNYVETVNDTPESAFVLLDSNMDGVLSRDEIEHTSDVSIRKFARMGYIYTVNKKLHGGGPWEDVNVVEGDKEEQKVSNFPDEVKFIEESIQKGYEAVKSSTDNKMDKTEFINLFKDHMSEEILKPVDFDFLFRILSSSKEYATPKDFEEILFEPEETPDAQENDNEPVVKKDNSDRNIHKRKGFIGVLDAMQGIYTFQRASEERLERLRKRQSRKEEL